MSRIHYAVFITAIPMRSDSDTAIARAEQKARLTPANGGPLYVLDPQQLAIIEDKIDFFVGMNKRNKEVRG